MALSGWSTTAASNATVGSINWAEGQNPNTVNNSARQEMADVREFYENIEWRDWGHTPTRTGDTTFTVATSADETDVYTVDRRIRCTDSSTLYGTITASSYSAPTTTVTVSLDSGSLSASLSAVALGLDPTNTPVNNTTATTADQAKKLIDTNSVDALLVSGSTTPVNEVTVGNADTGSNPSLSATGDDTNIGLELTAKGTGNIVRSDHSVTLGSAASSISISSLSFPAGRAIEFEAALLGVTGAISQLFMHLSGDTTNTNYYSQRISNGVATGSVNSPIVGPPFDATDKCVITGVIVPNATYGETLVTWQAAWWDVAGTMYTETGSIRYTASPTITAVSIADSAVSNSYIATGSTLRLRLK